MTTSLSVLLASETIPPPRAERARPYAVKVVRWREPYLDVFDVILPEGLLLRGCKVHVLRGERCVRATGYEFVSREDKDRFSVSVLAALDSGA